MSMVWIVADGDRSGWRAYASAAACRVAIACELDKTYGIRDVGTLWLRRLHEWDGVSEIAIGAFLIRPMQVQS